MITGDEIRRALRTMFGSNWENDNDATPDAIEMLYERMSSVLTEFAAYHYSSAYNDGIDAGKEIMRRMKEKSDEKT
jgi:hypothetical protein